VRYAKSCHGLARGGCGLEVTSLGFSPALEGAVKTGCCGDFDDLAGEKGDDGEAPGRGDAQMKEVAEPAGSKEEDRQGGGGRGDESASKSRGERLHCANDPSRGRCSQRIGEEKTAVGAEQVCDAAGGVWSEDGQAERAFSEIEHHCGEAGDGAERHADKDDGEVLERERDGCEGKRERDVRASSYERRGADDGEDFAGKGFPKRSGAVGETELRGDGGLHRTGSFRAVRFGEVG